MNTLLIFLKGLLMGIADVIPGVSGGTIAFITNIYDRFITALGSLSTAGKHWFRGEWKKGWKLIDFQFLIPLTLGLTSALYLGSKYVPPLLTAYPTYVLSFFIGLIIVSAYIVFSHIKRHDFKISVYMLVGTLAGFLVAITPSFQTKGGFWFMILMGFISITAMLLPGISGSYILLMFGQYEHLLNSLQELNWPIIIGFKIGAIAGLLIFSKVLSWLLKKYHSRTFATLTGIMIGALYRPLGEAYYSAEPGMLPLAVVFLFVGMFTVVAVQYLAHGNVAGRS